MSIPEINTYIAMGASPNSRDGIPFGHCGRYAPFMWSHRPIKETVTRASPTGDRRSDKRQSIRNVMNTAPNGAGRSETRVAYRSRYTLIV